VEVQLFTNWSASQRSFAESILKHPALKELATHGAKAFRVEQKNQIRIGRKDSESARAKWLFAILEPKENGEGIIMELRVGDKHSPTLIKQFPSLVWKCKDQQSDEADKVMIHFDGFTFPKEFDDWMTKALNFTKYKHCSGE
jgi:hypothetical protein